MRGKYIMQAVKFKHSTMKAMTYFDLLSEHMLRVT